MIYISNIASEKLAFYIKKDGLKLNKSYIRLSIKKGGCSGLSYNISFEKEKNHNDQIFEEKNIKIIINKNDLIYLDGIKIEYADTINGKGFYFKNPNAAKTCGCGSSFAPKK